MVRFYLHLKEKLTEFAHGLDKVRERKRVQDGSNVWASAIRSLVFNN